MMNIKGKRDSLFWTSYSDLMTSLFFVMLTLFVVAVIAMGRALRDETKLRELTEEKLKKIREIESSIENIDSTWFEYNKKHKKHVLKIDVSFDTGKADIENIPLATREELYKAGKAIEKFLDKAQAEFGDTVKYLLIIEGQASNDGYSRNYELSYDRALSFFNYLKLNRNVDLRRGNCEVLICGSGTHGAMRAEPDNATNKNNQRFLIHILPKPGIIE